jgi:hypothetical protein
MQRTARHVGIVVVFSTVAAVAAAPATFAGVTCSIIPSMCPPAPGNGGGGQHSVPEPGTLGLLAVGAAAGLVRLRQRLKKKD